MRTVNQNINRMPESATGALRIQKAVVLNWAPKYKFPAIASVRSGA